MDFAEPTTIASDSIIAIDGGDLWLFGILESAMFTAWCRAIGGRIKNDLRFSAEVVYNTFPFPAQTQPSAARIEAAAQGVLDVRCGFPTSSLADLYDPVAMPPALVAAHEALDTAVDRAFGRRSRLRTDADRLPVLFARYASL